MATANASSTPAYDDQFSIVITQKFMEVRSGQHVPLSLTAKSPRYFVYN